MTWSLMGMKEVGVQCLTHQVGSHVSCKVSADSVVFSCDLISEIRQGPGRTANSE